MFTQEETKEIRAEFPILGREVYGRPLVYLDNAATTQKPLRVLDAMRQEYLNANANVHRGVHYLSQRATELHEAARECVGSFINAPSAGEIVFTRGTTESINLVAQTFAEAFLGEGDTVLVTEMEHHSNIVPWQLQARRHGFAVKPVPITDRGELDTGRIGPLLDGSVKFLSLAHVSNVLGTVNPVKEIIHMAHSKGVPVMVDGAQAVPHMRVDVQDLDADFYAFSGHKMYGPTGIGVLYGKKKWLDRLPPYQGGGEMIDHVSFAGTTFGQPPLKFEAGTPDYVATHGLAAAIDFMESIGMERINEHERSLTVRCMELLGKIPGMRIIGQAAEREAVVSFLVGHIHHLDMGTLLDRMGIAVRTGHHCAEPLMDRLGLTGTIRASLALYNTEAEIAALAEGVRRAARMF